MMKRFLVFLITLLFLLSLSFWFFSSQRNTTEPIEEKQEVKKEEIGAGMKSLVYHGEKFFFLAEKISEPQKLILLPNFEEKLSSTTLYQNNNCRFLANGGFYDQQDRPLGWFFTQDKLWKKESKSALLNGFLALNKEGIILLDEVFPTSPVIWGLQTGPVLIFKDKPLELKMVKDEPARRMVAAINQNDELFFVMVTGSKSLASGPFLADLPLIIKQIGQGLSEDFKIAINLDGGTASAFLSQGQSIKEYTWIGSFFCLQENK